MSVTALLPLCQATAADNTHVRITDANGKYTEFVFSKQPVVTIGDDSLVMKTTDQTVKYPLTGELTFTFSSEATSISEIHQSCIASFHLYANALVVNGIAPSSTLRLYDTAGVLRQEAAGDASGKAEIDLTGLAHGIYIVKTSKQSFKFYKK